jgi:uncharacterized membrane protein YgdD (TMEM256/DUF423 family)
MISLAWTRFFLVAAGLLGATGVAAGAFASHGLTNLVNEVKLIEYFELAALYQLLHAVALLAVALAASYRPLHLGAVIAGLLFSVGVVLFSGSLYLRVLTGVADWGSLTPLGGSAFILGWLVVAFSGIKATRAWQAGPEQRPGHQRAEDPQGLRPPQ